MTKRFKLLSIYLTALIVCVFVFGAANNASVSVAAGSTADAPTGASSGTSSGVTPGTAPGTSTGATPGASGPGVVTDAEICEKLGVLLGSGNGVDAVYLSEYATRAQAAYITLRLVGREAEAKNYTGLISFRDVFMMEYSEGRKMLNYLKNYPEYGWQGDENGNMNPDGLVSAQAMYKVALTVLGYRAGEDFEWDNTIAFAKEKGLGTLGYKMSFLTNNDVAVILVETLKANMKGSSLTLFDHLVALNVIDSQKAYEVSLIPGGPGYIQILPYSEGGPLVIEITSDISKSQLRIKFNVNLNPSYAKSLKNYEYFVYGKGYIPLPLSCVTSIQNENTVVIQFPEKGWIEGNVPPREAFITYVATYGRNEIKISGLLDVDGNELEDIYIDVPR